MTSKSALLMSCAAVVAWLFVAPRNATAQNARAWDKAEYNTVELLRLMDKDKNGNVSRAEFDNYMNKEFDSLDVHHDGQLDENELARLHWNYLATQLLPLMDWDQTGKVSRQEFMSFMDRQFDRLDINRNGRLDVDELAATHFPHTGRK